MILTWYGTLGSMMVLPILTYPPGPGERVMFLFRSVSIMKLSFSVRMVGLRCTMLSRSSLYPFTVYLMVEYWVSLSRTQCRENVIEILKKFVMT